MLLSLKWCKDISERFRDNGLILNSSVDFILLYIARAMNMSESDADVNVKAAVCKGEFSRWVIVYDWYV